MVISSQNSKQIDRQLEPQSYLASAPHTSGAIDLTDVPQMLSQWESVLNLSNPSQVRQQLSIQAEMWLTLGHKLAIPEFVEIAQVVQTVLAERPSLAIAVGKLALKGWEFARVAYQSDLELQLDTGAEDYNDGRTPSKLLNDATSDAATLLDPISLSFLDAEEHIYLPPSLSVEDLIEDYTLGEELLPDIVDEPSSTEEINFDDRLHLDTEKLLIWQSANLIFTIPSSQILEISEGDLSCELSELEWGFITWQDREIPLFQLEQIVKYRDLASEAARADSGENNNALQPEGAFLIVLQIATEIIAVNLIIDRLISYTSLDILPFGSALLPPKYISGCALLDGRLVPVVEVIRSIEEQVGVFSQPKILIVDDSKTVREVLRITLEEANYQVCIAENGEQAIEYCHQHPDIKLILCDLEMPKVNGFEFLVYRRQQPQWAEIPVIMLTFRQSDREKKLAFQLGAAAFMNKPYLKEDLLATIEEIMGCESFERL